MAFPSAIGIIPSIAMEKTGLKVGSFLPETPQKQIAREINKDKRVKRARAQLLGEEREEKLFGRSSVVGKILEE